MSPILEQLRDHWLAQNVEIGGGASEEEVAAFERANGVSLPPLFREYVREINGMANAATDNYLISFWALERIESGAHGWKSDRPEDACRFIFADYLISSHEYNIQLFADAGTPAPVRVYDIVRVASFEEFLVRYMAGDEELIYLVGH